MLGSLNNNVLLGKDVSSFHFTRFIVSPSCSCPLRGKVLAGTKFFDISDIKICRYLVDASSAWHFGQETKVLAFLKKI